MLMDRLIAGDTLDFDTAVMDTDGNQYTPADGWSMVLRIVPRSSGSVYTITATATDDGGSFNCAAAASTTANWAAGSYSAMALLSKSGERKTVYLGEVEIQADPGLATTYDVRSEAKAALDAALTLYHDFASHRVHVLEYEVAGRRMKFAGADQLVKHIEFLRREVAQEESAARLAAGLGGRKVLTRFHT